MEKIVEISESNYDWIIKSLNYDKIKGLKKLESNFRIKKGIIPNTFVIYLWDKFCKQYGIIPND